MKIHPLIWITFFYCAGIFLIIIGAILIGSNKKPKYGIIERCEEKFCKVNVPSLCVHGKCYSYWVPRDTLKPGDIIADPFK